LRCATRALTFQCDHSCNPSPLLWQQIRRPIDPAQEADKPPHCGHQFPPWLSLLAGPDPGRHQRRLTGDRGSRLRFFSCIARGLEYKGVKVALRAYSRIQSDGL
jgi:hypothetical protein